MNKAKQMICPPDRKQSKLGALLSSLSEVVAEERKKLLAPEMEQAEESKRLRVQQITEGAEEMRLTAALEQRRNQRICREITERDYKQTQVSLQEAKKPFKRQMEKILKKLIKTIDFLERAKRGKSAPLIEAAYQQCLMEERILHDREQQICLYVYLCRISLFFFFYWK
ncbi:hypothetical protein MtrunA17_Chr7g0234611 [Medicago truncatula]|uniref:Uncharacterized protein n=1 Tax=Medicago truncatula TaxID=3880 RepID=A0A396GZ33_MEDTR|nr:eukaryotic translation initiation factor 3 subunit A [Medicago truncatula]RHN45738.1 hypothetical protein MtrunA17_Chr7g0234611 [Medicago truncatula]